jgi:hypothetical protein
VLISVPGWGGSVDAFALRNPHPFLHIYGLPPLQDAELVERGKTDYGFAFTVVNNAEIKDTDTESIRLDGETYFADFRLRRRVHERLEIGVDIPYVKHSPGVLDDAIFDWHDFWGMSNSKRDGASNELNYRYLNNGSVEQQITSSSSGIGDVQLSAAMPFFDGGERSSRLMTVRFSVKLPTGDSEDLHGSGALDAALGIYAQESRTLFGRDFAYSGFAGIMALGDGDVFEAQQRTERRAVRRCGRDLARDGTVRDYRAAAGTRRLHRQRTRRVGRQFHTAGRGWRVQIAAARHNIKICTRGGRYFRRNP